MKYLKILRMAFPLLFLILLSCSDDIKEYSTENNKDEERLHFVDENQLREAIEGSDRIPISLNSSKFKSLMSTVDNNFKNSEEKTTYYEMLGYDSLVPNINSARLLNTKGEVIVCAKMGDVWRGMRIVKK